jgi:hypothetical protein
MKRKRHTPEQVVRKLREGDRMLNEEGQPASASLGQNTRSQPGASDARSVSLPKRVLRDGWLPGRVLAGC